MAHRVLQPQESTGHDSSTQTNSDALDRKTTHANSACLASQCIASRSGSTGIGGSPAVAGYGVIRADFNPGTESFASNRNN